MLSFLHTSPSAPGNGDASSSPQPTHNADCAESKLRNGRRPSRTAHRLGIASCRGRSAVQLEDLAQSFDEPYLASTENSHLPSARLGRGRPPVRNSSQSLSTLIAGAKRQPTPYEDRTVGHLPDLRPIHPSAPNRCLRHMQKKSPDLSSLPIQESVQSIRPLSWWP